jgi:hypothetical protein
LSDVVCNRVFKNPLKLPIAFEKESFFAMEICIPALKEKPKLKTDNLQKVTEIKHTYKIPIYKDNENSKIILTRKVELETIERFK